MSLSLQHEYSSQKFISSYVDESMPSERAWRFDLYPPSRVITPIKLMWPHKVDSMGEQFVQIIGVASVLAVLRPSKVVDQKSNI